MTKRGFTLIELLVVISIIALLSSIVMSSISETRAKSRDTQKIQLIKQIQVALEMYRNDNGGYPSYYYTDSVNLGGVDALKNELVKGKYISDFNTKNIQYFTPETVITSTCTNGTGLPPKKCPNYKIGITLEKTNPVISTDSDKPKTADSAYDFWGNRGCQNINTDPGGNDICYDYATF